MSRSKSGKLVAAFAAAGMVLTPALATAQAKKRPAAVAVSFDPVATFTPANADPRLAAAFAGKANSLSDFKFTPAPAKGRPSQVRVAIRARADGPGKVRVADAAALTSINALTPASYNLGVAVGWRRFAVAGDVARTKDGNPALGGRESAALGVSYSVNKRLTGRVAVGADRGDGRALTPLRKADNYSLDVGGAYSLTRNIAVTGGVRYRVDHERLSALKDDRRDSQAVYVGTAFKF
ncbi:MAG TPA: porin [Sphingomicrobium sp.]|nr:porin [Sphingomicrobium sp.]